MPKVFISHNIDQTCAKTLRDKGFDVEINNSSQPLANHKFKEVFAKFDAVVTTVNDKIDEEIIKAASPKLKIIANYAVGFDNIDVLGAKRKGIVTTNTPGVASEAVAEHTFALIFACSKRILEADKYVRQGKFKSWDATLFVSGALWGKTIGIIGLGKIGTLVGHIANGGMKMNILYHDIVRSYDFELLTESKFVSLDYLLKEADVVTLHVPLTPHTHHLIGKGELTKMKAEAILINTARGAIVDEKALVWALREKVIAAAGLDVFENEPQVESELLTLANVVLTPHVGSATVECREQSAKIVAENILAVFEGKQPPGLVKVS